MSAPSTYEGHTYVLLYEGVRLNKEAEENIKEIYITVGIWIKLNLAPHSKP